MVNNDHVNMAKTLVECQFQQSNAEQVAFAFLYASTLVLMVPSVYYLYMYVLICMKYLINYIIASSLYSPVHNLLSFPSLLHH